MTDFVEVLPPEYRHSQKWSNLCAQHGIPGLALSTADIRQAHAEKMPDKIQFSASGETFYTHDKTVSNADALVESVDEYTIFEAGSLSKTVVSYLFYQLTQDDALCSKNPLYHQLQSSTKQKELLADIKDKLSRDRASRITAEMILSHTSGFEGWRGNLPLTVASEPGSRFYYSGEGYLFLQRFLELYFNMPIESLFQKRLFSTLGMTHSSFHCPNQSERSVAIGHDRTGKQLPKYREPKAVIAGSLHTSLNDYTRFLSHVIEKNSIAGGYFDWVKQHTVQTPVQDIIWAQGWGLLNNTLQDEAPYFWHWGDTGGFNCFVILAPQTAKFLTYFTNSQRGLTALNKIVTETDFPICETGVSRIRALIDTVTNQKPGLERYWFDYNAQRPFYSLSYE